MCSGATSCHGYACRPRAGLHASQIVGFAGAVAAGSLLRLTDEQLAPKGYIHPAIVAGRVRMSYKDYRVLSGRVIYEFERMLLERNASSQARR